MVLKNDDLGGSSEKPALNTTLMELILSNGNISRAWKQVKANGGSAGVDRVTVDQFPDYFRPRWKRIRQALQLGYYVPLPVLRVEIPKASGGTRKLGIPSVIDRVIQQAIAQVLGPMFDPGFSEASYGFRPGRSAHGAIRRVQDYVKSGFRIAVDVDIEKFFDTVDHDILMNCIARKVRDKSVLRLIGRYLRAGVRERTGERSPSPVGTPQGGPLSPLLSNILLDNLDKELERNGYRFVRYADDFVILTRSKAQGKAVLEDVTTFLEAKLKLTVNSVKSKVAPIQECGFLGFTIQSSKIRWTDKAFAEFKRRIKKLTGRSWGVSMWYRLGHLRMYIQGWMNYYGISQFYRPIQDIDDWIRRRIRMCYWKLWRHTRTKIRKLKELGLPEHFAVLNGASSKSYWRMSKTYGTNAGMSNQWLESQGLVNVKALWCKAQGYT